jgi:hypothetical protein
MEDGLLHSFQLFYKEFIKSCNLDERLSRLPPINVSVFLKSLTDDNRSLMDQTSQDHKIDKPEDLLPQVCSLGTPASRTAFPKVPDYRFKFDPYNNQISQTLVKLFF